jgi:FkbM family methyltransferase
MPPLRHIKQKLKRAWYAAMGFRPDASVPVETVNPGNQAWYFTAGSLKPGDIVYSLGLATNIEFDLNLIAKYDVEVHGFDPTPSSVEWIRSQQLPPAFYHHAIAIGGHNGEMVFELPDKEGACARAITQPPALDPRPSTLSTRHSLPATLPVTCRRLPSIAAELGHQRIALLKMDVEGSEYAILDDLLQSDLQVRQILVEFHHRFPELNFAMTKQAVRELRSRGYKLIHLSPWCEEMTFIKQ